jgi:hypothetical protein
MTSASSFSAVSRAGEECGGQPAVAAVAHHVVHAQFVGDGGGAVAAAVVDDQPLDDVEPGHLGGEISDGGRQRCFLVEARDLDDQLGGSAVRCHRR